MSLSKVIEKILGKRFLGMPTTDESWEEEAAARKEEAKEWNERIEKERRTRHMTHLVGHCLNAMTKAGLYGDDIGEEAVRLAWDLLKKIESGPPKEEAQP